MPKLLLADDSVTVQRVIALTFAGEGLEVVAVGDGDEAVERIDRDRPDIVLADLSMPGRDGYGVAEYVKRSPAHVANTRVVLLTGAFEPVEESRSRELGIDGVLAKPFEPQVAIGLVKRLLAQAPLAPSAPGRWAADGGSDQSQEAGGSASMMQRAAATGESGLASDLPATPPVEEAPGPGALDDYFRRLDEALVSAGLEASPAARTIIASASVSSDAETLVIPAPPPRPAPSEPDPATPAGQTTMTPQPLGAERSPASAAPAASSPSAVSLVDAFAALLAVEEGREPEVALPAQPEAAAGQPSAVDLDALADAVARRALDKLTDARIREIVSERVVEIAERLVREEIERIKAEAS
jgi:CheY-like chemotaxis protein